MHTIARFNAIVLSIAIASMIAPVVPAKAESVELSEIFQVQVRVKDARGKQRNKDLSCRQNQPGTIKESVAALNFTPLSSQLKKAKKSGAPSERVAYLRRLLKAGGKKCRSGVEDGEQSTGSSSVTSAGSTASNLSSVAVIAAPFSNLLGSSVAQSTGDRKITANALSDELASFFQCATVGSSGSTFSVDFGSGCEVAGITFSGSLSASTTLSGTSLQVEATFNQLSANGYNLSGTASFALTLSGISQTLDLTVSNGSTSFNLQFSGTVARDATGVLINGSGSIEGVLPSFTATDLHKTFTSGCYPDGGTLTLNLAGVPTIVITFNSSTPLTGTATVKVGDLPETEEALPACLGAG